MIKSAMIVCCLVVGTAALSHGASVTEGPQSIVSPAPAKQRVYPKIVLYSVSWCSHCKEAKEYFTHNNIPFVNHDVELEEEAMDTLTNKYKSKGVPVIVLGNDEKVLKGFNKDAFEKAVEEMRNKK
jgi:glutaredoxin-like YruB-family protein